MEGSTGNGFAGVGSAARRVASGLALGLVAGLIVFPFATSVLAGNEDKPKCKAKDANGDGVYDQGETQECGGDVYGVGGDDAADHPVASDGSHQWGPYHWTKPENDERKVIIRDSTTDSWTTKLPNAISDWGQSSKFRFVKQQAATDATTRQQCNFPDNYGRVHVCNYSYSWSDSGRANIRVNSANHIQKGWAKLNNTVSEGNRRSTICHELGHTLGLDHRSVTSSCMYGPADAFPTSPDNHDYDQLVNQTHHHGGESETGGINSDLDVGGGIQDGCSSFICFDVGERAKNGSRTIHIRFLALPPPRLMSQLARLL